MTQKNTPSKDRASYRLYRVERSRGTSEKYVSRLAGRQTISSKY